MWASGCPWCKAPLGARGPWAAFTHRALTTLECSAAWGHQQPLMPGRCWPGLGTTSPARAVLHAGICPQCQAPCWHHHCPTAVPVRGFLLGCGTPWSCCGALPQRAEQSLRRALVAQFANPSGTMWEEICFLNVSHYQLMGMLANGESSETRGCPSAGWWEGCANAGAQQGVGLAVGSPETANSSKNDC